MSEHMRRHSRPVVINFPRPYDEEAETAAFVRRFLVDMMPRAEHFRNYVECGGLPIDALLRVGRESFEALVLLWAGLPPRQADEFIDRLAPRWAQLVAMMERNREMARAQGRGHLNG